MRVERLLRKMEERSKRRQKRKDEVSCLFSFAFKFRLSNFSGTHSIKRKSPKAMMIQMKSEIFAMPERIWAIISSKQHWITLYESIND